MTSIINIVICLAYTKSNINFNMMSDIKSIINSIRQRIINSINKALRNHQKPYQKHIINNLIDSII